MALACSAAAGFVVGRVELSKPARSEGGQRWIEEPLDLWLREVAEGEDAALLGHAEAFLFGAARSAEAWRQHARGVRRLGRLALEQDRLGDPRGRVLLEMIAAGHLEVAALEGQREVRR